MSYNKQLKFWFKILFILTWISNHFNITQLTLNLNKTYWFVCFQNWWPLPVGSSPVDFWPWQVPHVLAITGCSLNGSSHSYYMLCWELNVIFGILYTFKALNSVCGCTIFFSFCALWMHHNMHISLKAYHKIFFYTRNHSDDDHLKAPPLKKDIIMKSIREDSALTLMFD